MKKIVILASLLLIGIIGALAVFLLSDRQEDFTLPDEGPTDPNLPRHTLVYAGDFFSARRLNLSLWRNFDKEMPEIYGNVAPLFRDADIAMLNVEGMISAGGYFNQLRACTWMFRAQPKAVDILQSAGIDIAILNNNHNGDYGPEAIVEETDHLMAAGIDYLGAGVDAEDASRPIYKKIGDTVVAIIGAEFTVGDIYAATKKRAGVHFLKKALKNAKDDDFLVGYFKKRVAQARKNADVVLFTPHWDAWIDPPSVSDGMRDFARRLIVEAGFDAILGHGRHHTQGVELFHGRPVVYDAGNSMLDHSLGKKEDTRGMVWKVEFTKAGVVALEGTPIKIKLNRTRIAKGGEAQKVLDRVVERSAEYGTTVRVENGRALVEAQPGRAIAPTVAQAAPPRPSSRNGIRWAPTDVLHERLPEGVETVDVRYENGIRLVGYELLSKKIVQSPCTSQTVVLYWTTDRPIAESYVVHLEARAVKDGAVAPKNVRIENHLPGDWMLPTALWPPGKIVQDETNVRLPLSKEKVEEIAFVVGLRKLTGAPIETDRNNESVEGNLIAPQSDGGLERVGDLLVLGKTPLQEGAPRPAEIYEKWRERRKIELSPVQPPFGAPPLVWGRAAKTEPSPSSPESMDGEE